MSVKLSEIRIKFMMLFSGRTMHHSVFYAIRVNDGTSVTWKLQDMRVHNWDNKIFLQTSSETQEGSLTIKICYCSDCSSMFILSSSGTLPGTSDKNNKSLKWCVMTWWRHPWCLNMNMKSNETGQTMENSRSHCLSHVSLWNRWRTRWACLSRRRVHPRSTL